MIKDYIVQDEVISYSGPFELKELYQLIDHFIKNHHYDKKEKRHYEKKTEDDRYIELELEPAKIISDYIRLSMNMLIFIKNLKDIKVEIKGQERVIQQADVSIRFRAFVMKDYEQTWHKRPLLFFFRSLVDKFIYTTHMDAFADEVRNDARVLQQNIKSFLNLYQRR